MKWILFTGTWRLTNKEVEKDVRDLVKKVFSAGDNLIVGGATGVDYFALNEAMKNKKNLNRVRVVIPARLSAYKKDYHKNWSMYPITKKDINNLIEQLTKLKEISPASLLEFPQKGDLTQDDYYKMNDELVRYADEVCAFQVNNSTGTQDAIDKAKNLGLKIKSHKKYSIIENNEDTKTKNK